MTSVGPRSTIRPAYITQRVSQVPATTPREWVIRMTAVPSLLVSSCMISSIWAWMVTSRALVGSSAMRISGLQERLMAIITRWRMPPENWCGYWSMRFSGAGMPASLSISMAFCLAASLSSF